MASDNVRAKFVSNVVDFVRKYNFDGFDLDWEYPNQRGGVSADVQNFVKLTKELKKAFQPYGLLLTAAVAASELSVSQSYDVPGISAYLDFINIMTYDLHGSWDGKTGHNAPLAPSIRDVTSVERQLNVMACVDMWIRKGAPAHKLIMEMATYGRTYSLDNIQNNVVCAPAKNPGKQSPYTQQEGMLGYNEIVELQNQGGWSIKWDAEQFVPYMYKENQWVSYDDKKSLQLKVEYAVAKGLGGIMIWSIETDDFRHGYPLLTAINQDLSISVPAPHPTTTLADKPVTTARTEMTMSTSNLFLCKTTGYKTDPNDCNKYYYCQDGGNGKFITYTFRKPSV